MGRSDVAVTGLGCICAAGDSVDACMHSMARAERNAAPPRWLRVDLTRTYPVFEVPHSTDDLASTCRTRPSGHSTRTLLLALRAVEEALAAAGLDAPSAARPRIGICLGTTVGCTLNNEVFYRAWRAGEEPDVDAVRRYLACNPAEATARLLQLGGPSMTVANACSSGTDAIGLALRWLRAGRCDVAVAGGCDELSRIPLLGFIRLLIAGEEACRPFAPDRTGLNLGEGAGVIVLERPESARARGVQPLARLAGYGNSSDSHHPTAPHREGRGLRRAIETALGEAGVDAGAVDLVNAHGTATPENDRVEGQVIRDVYGASTPIAATKGYTGHTLGAAGGIEAVFTVRAMLDGAVPPAPWVQGVDPEIGVAPSREARAVTAHAAVSHSLAFGGTNSVLVFTR